MRCHEVGEPAHLVPCWRQGTTEQAYEQKSTISLWEGQAPAGTNPFSLMLDNSRSLNIVKHGLVLAPVLLMNIELMIDGRNTLTSTCSCLLSS